MCLQKRSILRSMKITLPSLFNLIIILLLSVIKSAFLLNCEPPDRKYSCDCSLEPGNSSIFMELNGLYNASTDNFVPALKSLQYCHGSFYCKPDFKLHQPSEIINTNNYLVCFSDDTCLSNGNSHSHQSLLTRTGIGESCISKGCMDIKDLLDFNITNDVLEVGAYKCIKVGPEGLKSHYCLNPICNSFTALEKLCVCNYQTQNCSCSTYCQNLYTSVSHKTYALFLSFGDIYVTTGAKTNYFHYLIVVILCFGLMILLIIFCNLCNASVDMSGCNETENTEALRRILTATLDPSPPPLPPLAKESELCTVGIRGSPPPSYEQVLKDKCIEFKKSVI